MPEVLQTRPTDWRYVSEGGATIVFSYKGPFHSDFDGTVLRLRKTPIVTAAASKPDSFAASSEESDDPTVEFQAKCIQRLIPPEHLPRLETVRLSKPWLQELVRFQDHVRPEARRQKDRVDLNRTKAVLATDLVGGNWLAVEIKPKWAFLPSSTHLSEETKGTKTLTCRFCMHSHFRARNGHQTVTSYCPLDLFSRDKTRVHAAIISLWETWIASDATVNNLKIFASGKYIRPSEVEKLLADSQASERDSNAIRDAFAAALLRPLLQTKVLDIISDLQRKLDVLDIEGLSKLWREAESAAHKQSGTISALSVTPLGRGSPSIQILEPGILDWTEFLDRYLSHESKEIDHSKPSPNNLRYYLLAYLLSATFKDCSIIVRLDFLRPGMPAEHEIQPRSVAVIDLDPKPMNKLKDWEELDREIVSAYSPEQKKLCIDAWRRSYSIMR